MFLLGRGAVGGCMLKRSSCAGARNERKRYVWLASDIVSDTRGIKKRVRRPSIHRFTSVRVFGGIGGRNRLAGSGRPGPARASRISWDRDGSDRPGPAVSRGLVVKVTRDSFSILDQRTGPGASVLFW